MVAHASLFLQKYTDITITGGRVKYPSQVNLVWFRFKECTQALVRAMGLRHYLVQCSLPNTGNLTETQQRGPRQCQKGLFLSA